MNFPIQFFANFLVNSAKILYNIKLEVTTTHASIFGWVLPSFIPMLVKPVKKKSRKIYPKNHVFQNVASLTTHLWCGAVAGP